MTNKVYKKNSFSILLSRLVPVDCEFKVIGEILLIVRGVMVQGFSISNNLFLGPLTIIQWRVRFTKSIFKNSIALYKMDGY